jgi:hypothetical protein
VSHPAAFVLPGAGLALLLGSLRGGRAALLRVVAVAVAWSASAALLYVLSLRELASNATLTNYWQTSFAPLGAAELWNWTARMTGLFFGNVAGLAPPLFAWILVATGLVSLVVSRPHLAVALALPLPLAWAASALHLYPYSGRMLLFAVPTTLLLVAAAMALAATVARRLAETLGGAKVSRVAGALAIAAPANCGYGLGATGEPVQSRGHSSCARAFARAAHRRRAGLRLLCRQARREFLRAEPADPGGCASARKGASRRPRRLSRRGAPGAGSRRSMGRAFASLPGMPGR